MLDVARGKRGQITIFMILGIIILLVLVLVILLQQEVLTFKPGELALTEKGKVERYITTCIQKVGEDSLFLIGLYGGYINITGDLLTDSSQHLKLSPYDVVPYWAKGTSTRIPSLDDIKSRIDLYVEDNLRKCLLDKKPFEDTYTIVEKSKIEADTDIVDKKVIFNVKWDLEIRDKAGEVVTEIINHIAESKIKLKRTYLTAKSIIDTEMNELKLEDLTIDLISLDHPKVPMMGVEMDCSEKKWNFNEVKDKLKDMLRYNVNKLKIKNTDYVDFPKSLPYYQNHYIWDTGVSYPDIGVTFNYNNNFPFYFEVTPRDGNLMKSGMTGGYDVLSKICVQMWKFTYDVMYPVSVEVTDEENDYVFRTSFTVHVKRNRADRSGEVLIPSSTIVDIPASEEYCKKRTIPMTVRTFELIENNDTGVYWTDPLDEVDLTFTCLKYKCDVGQTEYGFGGMGHVSAYKTSFPYCAGGILRGEKEDYTETWKRVISNKEQTVDLELIPLFQFPASNIKILKYGFTDLTELSNGKISASGMPLKTGEIVSIKITRNRDSWGKHEEDVIVSPDIDVNVSSGTYLDFLKGTEFEYELELYLMDDKEIKGGYKGNWTVDWDDLRDGKEITFKILSKDSFSDQTQQFDLISGLEKYSSINSAVLGPQIK